MDGDADDPGSGGFGAGARGGEARAARAVPGLGELDRAHRLIRLAGRELDRTAAREGWAVPFSPVRFLILGHLAGATALGLSPAELARRLAMRRSSVAHHLDALEGEGLIRRRPLRLYDRRKVAVLPTVRGLWCAWTLGSAVARAPVGGPAPVTPRRGRSPGTTPGAPPRRPPSPA